MNTISTRVLIVARISQPSYSPRADSTKPYVIEDTHTQQKILYFVEE